jgi:hypothetical protein
MQQPTKSRLSCPELVTEWFCGVEGILQSSLAMLQAAIAVFAQQTYMFVSTPTCVPQLCIAYDATQAKLGGES